METQRYRRWENSIFKYMMKLVRYFQQISMQIN